MSTATVTSYPSSSSTFFKGKFRGKKAELFAQGIEHYREAAETECNSAPACNPIFSSLSKEQRLYLVAQVSVGLLCESEPLPPNTIEHFAAYVGVIECLKTELLIEMDDVDNEAVGEDLIELYYVTCEQQEDCKVQPLTEDERAQRLANWALVQKRGEKNKKMLEKKSRGNDGDVKLDFETMHPGHTSEEDHLEGLLGYTSVLRKLFDGGPCSEELRRPPRPLTDEEKSFGFRWRLICDATFQEDDPTRFVSCSRLSFCWNCYDIDKWHQAVELLFYTLSCNYSQDDMNLVMGEIDERAYADRSNHLRIQAVRSMVKALKRSFESQFDYSKGATDQRLIYALSATELYFGRDHKQFVSTFYATCKDKYVDFHQIGNYQKRYDIFKALKEMNEFENGVDKSFSHGDKIEPSTHNEFDIDFALRPRCENICFSFYEESQLQFCSKCKVVRYCSRECQKKDWPQHKKVCALLADSRKDKSKIEEIARGL